MAITLERTPPTTETHTAREFHILRGPDWRAAAWAGIIGACVSLVLQIILSAATGHSAWMPFRMMSLLMVPVGSLPFPGAGNIAMAIGGLVLSLALGVAYAAILSDFISYQRPGVALAMGIAFGFVLYLINFYALASTFPRATYAYRGWGSYPGWINWVSHLVFGAVAAWSYKAVERVYEPALSRRAEVTGTPTRV